MRKSTVESAPRDDPLFMDSVMPPGFTGFSPVVRIPKIHSGFEGLPAISHEIYRRLAAESNNFARKVAPSAFDYYAAVIATARHIEVADKNGANVTSDEKDISDKVIKMNFQPPVAVTKYLDGVGSTSMPSGRKVRLDRRPIEYEAGNDPIGDIPGYFERVNADTHYLYNSLPCLGVYFQRIREDILKTNDNNRNPNWNLPPNIRPEDGNAGLPTRNLLGWKPSVRLKEDQLHFLYDCGFTAQGECTFQVPRFPINMDLLLSIQQEINNLKVETRETGNLMTGPITIC